MKKLVNLITDARGGIGIFVLSLAMILHLISQNGLAQELIKDLNRSENPEINEYALAVDLNGILFFNSLNDLWVTKQTPASSVMLKHFNSLGEIVKAGTRVFFTADGGTGLELWKSNGTPAGTVLVKDIFPGTNGSSAAQLTAVGSIVYFIADDGLSGRELWKSDGTPTGTIRVKDILAGKGSCSASYLTGSNGRLFFVANDVAHGYELWKSDGTAAGTVMVKDIVPAAKSGSFPKVLTNVNGVLFFTADDKIAGRELWKSNGTSAGTIRVKDIVAGITTTRLSNFTAVGSTLFFSADDRLHGEELWRSNGTSSGTLMVKDLTPGPSGSMSRGDFSQKMPSFTNVNGKLYFSAYSRSTYYFWKSDGTTAGTVPFYQPIVGALMSPGLQANFTFLNNNVYFNDVACDRYEGVFVSIYTMREDPSGVVSKISSLILWDFYDSRNQIMLRSGMNLYMTGRRGIAEGYALFRCDGISQAKKVIDAYSQKDRSGSPDLFTKTGSLIYFRTSFDYGLGYVLQSVWVTDGTANGTRMLIALNSVSELTVVDNVLYFIGFKDGTFDIYRSDGTHEGTTALGIDTPPDTYFLSSLTSFKGKLYYFWSRYSNEPHHLWVKSATEMQEIGVSNYPSGLVAAGNYLYFTNYTSELGTELYKSDGTVAGTTLVKDIFPGSGSSNPSGLTSYKNYLFFSANDGVHGDELWRSGGTAASTIMLKNLSATNTKNGAGGVQHFQVVNGQLYLTSDDVATSSLWKSDGTSAGTSLVSKIHRPLYLIDGGTNLFFISSFEGQFELWKRGTNTAPLKLMESPTLLDSNNTLFDYTTSNNIVYLTNGHQLFQSNGSACGTFQVPVTITSVFPIDHLGSDLIFGGTDPSIGNELFKLSISDIRNSCLALTFSDSDTTQLLEEIISVYPNPFSTDFTLRVNGNGGNFSVNVYDMKENVVKYQEVLAPKELRSFGADWRPGLYLIIVINKDRKKYFRVVKKP